MSKRTHARVCVCVCEDHSQMKNSIFGMNINLIPYSNVDYARLISRHLRLLEMVRHVVSSHKKIEIKMKKYVGPHK